MGEEKMGESTQNLDPKAIQWRNLIFGTLFLGVANLRSGSLPFEVGLDQPDSQHMICGQGLGQTLFNMLKSKWAEDGCAVATGVNIARCVVHLETAVESQCC